MIVGGCIMPHPPVIVPAVGKGKEEIIAATAQGCHKAAKMLAELKPETVVVISSHAEGFPDCFNLIYEEKLQGNLWAFGGKNLISATSDLDLIEKVERLCREEDFQAKSSATDADMDHATYVALYFLNQYYTDYKLVSCATSRLPLQRHYDFGLFIKKAIEMAGKRTAIIASGDLSHKLTENAPYGYAKEGKVLDEILVNIMKSGKLRDFVKLDTQLRRDGGECGAGAFATLAGILSGKKIKPEFHSYEGTLGVGYAVCSFGVDS